LRTLAAGFDTVVALWQHRTQATPDADGFYGRRDGSWTTLSWGVAGQRARAIACGLLALELDKGQRCAIACSTRPEWILADMGILCAGGATSTIFPSATLNDWRHILADSGARVCFVESKDQADRLLGLDLPELQHIVVIDGRVGRHARIRSLAQLEREGRAWDADHPGEYDDRAESVSPEDVATIIYTSGTTGLPKGVVLTHDNWVFEGEAMEKLGFMLAHDTHFLWLPLAHAYAKVLALASIRGGVPTAVDGSRKDLHDNLLAIRPTVMACVPRFFEKAWSRLERQAHRQGPVKRALFDRAMATGREMAERREAGEPPGPVLGARWRFFDRMVYQQIRDQFGGRLRIFISGAAPLSRQLALNFLGCGMLILEGYGLTESSAASLVNRPERFRLGTVGAPLNGVQLRIASDGEVLLSGRGVMRGYHGEQDDGALSVEDGWLHTGDIGRIDEQGFLAITGRKKELIITAGGKNLAPAPIEARLSSQSEIAEAVLFGDRQPYLVALLQAEDNVTDRELQHAVDRVNRELAHYEHIRNWARLPLPLSVEDGTLTPTRKLKRRVVTQRYGDLIDRLYLPLQETA
jgi:long-chain acyl-CoA synthetase